ncbi:MAG: MBL fold metallo-hydrolase [Syntrophotaleaceae bacterium]
MQKPSLEIVQIPAGEMQNFSYLVYCPQTLEGMAVDPSFEPERMLASADERGVKIKILANTHGHRDHIAGNETILRATGAVLAAHPLALPHADLALEDGNVLPLGKAEVTVIHTPGHTPGDITLHPPGALLTGDTLFVTKVGRADMQNSDPKALYRSLRRLAEFPDETLVYPGHDYGPQPVSTIGYEKMHNPYLLCEDLDGFIRLRMG